MFIHNDKIVDSDKNILLEKWKYETVYGETIPEKPGYCIFNNIRYAISMLHKHITNNSRIVFHTDVDVDGVGTTYILKKSLEYLGSTKHLLLINNDKIHGIQQKHATYFNDINPCADLIIITDSSCNEIDIIKQFKCDVLVVDHHELLHEDVIGKCNDGVHDYCIINNTVNNNNIQKDISYFNDIGIESFNDIKEYNGTSAMSCGLVIYELLRIYCKCYNNELLLENLMLYQWVGVTLYTDVIDTLNERNQWYLYNTVYNSSVERSLKLMLNNINKFKATLDKSYIQFSFAPLINKAIRAGKGSDIVNIVINQPYNIMALSRYGELQAEAIEKALYIKEVNAQTGIFCKKQRVFTSDSILLDLSNTDINANYNGVIASRLSGEYKKDTVVYRRLENGKFKGSFRGKFKTVDYRKYFADYSSDIYAQGHEGAFGFEATDEQLKYLMNNISSIEPDVEERSFISIGTNLEKENRGIYHVENFEEFKKQGYLYKIAIGNSKVISNDEISIRVSSKDVKMKKSTGKLFVYDVMGIECKAFEPMFGDYFDIYLEYAGGINAYLRKA